MHVIVSAALCVINEYIVGMSAGGCGGVCRPSKAIIVFSHFMENNLIFVLSVLMKLRIHFMALEKETEWAPSRYTHIHSGPKNMAVIFQI